MAVKKHLSCVSDAFCFLAVFQGGETRVFFEAVDVVAGTAETVFVGNFADGFCCLGETVETLFDTVFREVLKNGFAHVALEKAATFSGAKVDDGCNLLQGKLFSVIILKEGQQFF